MTDSSKASSGAAQTPSPEAKPASSKEIPKTSLKVGGLSPAAQRLQNLREKAQGGKGGGKPVAGGAGNSFKAKSLAGTKKTPFQRKAV